MNREIMTKLINECKKHIYHMSIAATRMSHLMPMTENIYRHLQDDHIASIDQFLFRFSKLQDTMGEKLFLALLLFLREDDMQSKPFIDILNRLEKIGVLENKNSWLELRRIRNDIVHHYDDEPIELSQAINNLFMHKEQMIAIFNNIETYYIARCTQEN